MPVALLTRIRAEYLEMPGLRLTIPQAQRLCGVEGASCKTALDALVAERFLCLRPDGSYARVTNGPSRAHPAKARLSPDRSSREPRLKSAS